MKKQLASFLENLVAEIKSHKLEEVRRLFIDTPENYSQQQKQEFLLSKAKVINDLANDGSNALHHAVQ